MNVSRALPLCSLGVVVALAILACEAADHPVGAETKGAINGEGGEGAAEEAGEASSGGVNGVIGSANTTGGGGNRANGSVNGSINNSADVVAAASVSSSTTGASSDLVVPGCTPLNSFQDEAQCELELECAGAAVFAGCFEFDDFFQCDCSSILPGIEFRASGITLSNACAQTLATCLSWPDVSAAFSCVAVSEVDEPDYCINDGQCDLVIAGDSDLIATYDVQSDCTWDDTGWTCGCGSPNGGRFKLRAATSDPPCLDARGWCGGIGLELIGNRTCTLTDQRPAGEFGCVANVECERAVTLSGQEATMYEDEVVDCTRSDNEFGYDCFCSLWGAAIAVSAEDLPSACAAAVSLCETEG